jgi:ABC-2 type transport system permease protein
VIAYLRLAAMQLRISAAAGMSYRADFLIEGAMTLATIAITLLPLIVVYQDRDTLAGWDQPSALVLMGYFVALRGMLEGVISPSILELVERIRSGSFDYVLLKPIDAQALISASRFEPWKVFDLLGALGLLVYAFYLRGAPPSLAHVGVGVLLFVSGLIAMYSIWIVCAAMAFWVVRLDNLTFLLGAIFDVARWPVQVFRGAWRIVFTFVIPVAVMTTFPAMGLLGELEPELALASAGASLVMLAIARLVWRSAIRNYTSASS